MERNRLRLEEAELRDVDGERAFLYYQSAVAPVCTNGEYELQNY